ncbi:Transcriptional regulator [Leuconostoc gelidum subsp. gasicomitatum]|uniref:Transcriptional regulator n=1 Tax=Leuconostoc gasicomitatum TaxID=115778 RepID=A0ABM9V5D6_9LACO|nr:TetR/AcrR family transcriptional regulator [Leuconostoc gasicomitatum]CUW13919.1 Transcriptional regulator [Leuconostoc gasicomitatum]
MEKLTQKKIIDTTKLLILETNTTDVTPSQIANKLGVTHGAIYKHFKNKQELWEAVAKGWFNQMISEQITITAQNMPDKKTYLHDWLWLFVNAKKRAYNENPKMFVLNTQYIDNNPFALRSVLKESYQKIDAIMNYNDPDLEKAEAIMSAFAVFTLPNFKELWNLPDYQKRFEAIWNLISFGI